MFSGPGVALGVDRDMKPGLAGRCRPTGGFEACGHGGRGSEPEGTAGVTLDTVALIEDDAPVRNARPARPRSAGFTVMTFECAEDFLAGAHWYMPDCWFSMPTDGDERGGVELDAGRARRGDRDRVHHGGGRRTDPGDIDGRRRRHLVPQANRPVRVDRGRRTRDPRPVNG